MKKVTKKTWKSSTEETDSGLAPVTKQDFITCMEQFFALRAHFEAVMIKSSTLQRVMDTGLKPVSFTGAIKTVIAVSSSLS